jgi:predicted transcriptional regulator
VTKGATSIRATGPHAVIPSGREKTKRNANDRTAFDLYLLTCLEAGKRVTMLKRRLRTAHGLTPHRMGHAVQLSDGAARLRRGSLRVGEGSRFGQKRTGTE